MELSFLTLFFGTLVISSYNCFYPYLVKNNFTSKLTRVLLSSVLFNVFCCLEPLSFTLPNMGWWDCYHLNQDHSWTFIIHFAKHGMMGLLSFKSRPLIHMVYYCYVIVIYYDLWTFQEMWMSVIEIVYNIFFMVFQSPKHKSWIMILEF